MQDEYIPLEEAAKMTGRDEQQLLRGALNDNYNLYQFQDSLTLTSCGWIKVPLKGIAKIYTGAWEAKAPVYTKDSEGNFVMDYELVELEYPHISDESPYKETDITWNRRSLHLNLEDIKRIKRETLMDGLHSSRSESQTDNTPPVSINYELMKVHVYEPEELIIGVEAWNALYGDEHPDGVKIRKPDISKWLHNNYPHLGNETVKRIATVVNPFKKGGATRSD
ncbi:MAG: hypothetical protein ACLFV2_01365 [Desulfurivibrionaceae bacterium]